MDTQPPASSSETTAAGPGPPGGLFLGFLYRLRSQGLGVTPQQWLTVVEGLVRGLHGSSLAGFYSLTRALLVRDESELDDFDLVFAEYFKGIVSVLPTIENEVWQWLESAASDRAVDSEWRALLERVDVEELRAAFEERLREQTERHDGGDHWIGTGGTSAFGHSGAHPGGLRVGGPGGGGSAVQVAEQRRYQEHRRDVVLDTRQLSLALKKLRALERVRPTDQLDVDATIDRTARDGGELDLVFERPRENTIELLMAMDIGGSMFPFRRLVDRLFSAAHAIRHFKRFDHVYFHNCIYRRVWTDARFSDPVPLSKLVQQYGRDTRLIVVGDANMYPGELTDRFGAIDFTERNEEPGVVYLERLRDHFKHTAWLNPMPKRMWQTPSVEIVGRIFEMYPLTVDGVERLAADLS